MFFFRFFFLPPFSLSFTLYFHVLIQLTKCFHLKISGPLPFSEMWDVGDYVNYLDSVRLAASHESGMVWTTHNRNIITGITAFGPWASDGCTAEFGVCLSRIRPILELTHHSVVATMRHATGSLIRWNVPVVPCYDEVEFHWAPGIWSYCTPTQSFWNYLCFRGFLWTILHILYYWSSWCLLMCLCVEFSLRTNPYPVIVDWQIVDCFSLSLTEP